MEELSIDIKSLIADCLKQKSISGDAIDLAAYLKGKGVGEQYIPAILTAITEMEARRRTAKSRIQEGGVITTIGLAGIGYAAANEKDGTAWLLWSVVGLGILANGLWKRKKIKQYR